VLKGISVESGVLDDIRLIPDPRTNNIIVSAPAKSVELIRTLISELDTPPAYRAEVNIFPLKRADASQLAATLQQLLLGTTSTTGGGGIPGGGLPGGTGPGLFPGVSGLGLRPLIFNIGTSPTEGMPLIDLRISVDPRTNSIIVAGSRNDLDVAEAIISKIEDAPVEQRRNEVYALRNSTSIDVANALTTFLSQWLTIYRNGGQLSGFQDLEREVVVVAEPITNKLLVSATARYFPDVMRMIAELDAELPQVMIQVLIAEVDLNNTEEFGIEIGLQTPVFFQRGIYAGTTTSSVTGLGPDVLAATTQTGTPAIGFPFNNPAAGLPNASLISPQTVGVQALNSFGTGRVSPNSGIGGFVFSAASDTFNVLIRALKQQGRADILSRPQIMTLDNQAAQVAVGQSVPYLSGSTLTATGASQQSVLYRDVGVILNVIPKISPDGKVTMRVTPQVSSVSATNVNLGAGISSPVFNQQLLDTTVTARDGETVALGGLITRSDSKSENKVPWFGDLPVLGAAFRYRQQVKKKTELLVILTPHIVRNRFDMERLLSEEGRKMDWVVGDVLRTQGTTGMHPLFAGPGGAPPGGAAGPIDGAMRMPAMPMAAPVSVPPLPGVMAPAEGGLPSPKPLPGGPGVGAATGTQQPPVVTAAAVEASARPLAAATTLPARQGPVVIDNPVPPPAAADSAPKKEESQGWRLFPRLFSR
jgi:type II secretory pathway component GspD/PulD (secretin)